MRLLALIGLILTPALAQAQEGEAEKLFRAMEKKILAAESLALEFNAEMKSGDKVYTSKGKINVAAGNKTRWEFESDLAKGVRTMVVTNGEVGYMKVGEKVSVPGPKAPKGSILLARIARFGAMFAVAERELKPSDPIKDFPVTDFKLGVKEMIGKREAQVVEYQMVQKKDKPTKVRWKTWIDTETNLPLKRSQVAELQGKRAFQMDEIYAVFTVDTKLDEKLFTIPQDTKLPEGKAPTTSTEWKVIAQHKFGPVIGGERELEFPFLPGPEDKFEAKGGVVFRNAAELAGRMLRDEKKGKDESEQKKAAEWAAKALKVERIDWDKQMLLLIYGGYFRADGNEVDLVSMTSNGKVLTVTYDVRLLEKMTGSHAPMALVLIEKFEGDVIFKAVGRAQEAPEPLMQWKVIASISAGPPMKPDISFREGGVFRNPEELARAKFDDPKKAKDEDEQKKAVQWAAEILKVERIDWDKQMLLCIDGGGFRGPYYAVNLVSIKPLGGMLTVRYEVVNKKQGAQFSHTPRALILVERFPGDVRFARVPQNRLPITALEILEQADVIEVLSLNPKESDKAGFAGFKVLGTVHVKGIRQRDLLLAALNSGTESHASGAPISAARNPRYGIQATHEGKTVSLQLCFDSSFIAVNVGKQFDLVPTSNSSQRLLDQLLRDAKVPQVPAPEKKIGSTSEPAKWIVGEIRPFKGNTGGVLYAAFSPDGKRVIAFRKDGVNHLWDVATGAMGFRISAPVGDGDTLEFSRDGNRVLFHSFKLNRVLAWDAETGKEVMSSHLHGSTMNLRFLPDGKRALSGHCSRVLQLWDTTTGKEIHSKKTHFMNGGLAVSPDGRLAVSASSEDGKLRLWDVDTLQEVRAFGGGAVLAGGDGVAFTPDGKYLVTSSFMGWDLVDVKSGDKVRTHEEKGWTSRFVILPDCRRVLFARNRMLQLWDVHAGKEIQQFDVDKTGRVLFAIAPDGRQALCSSKGSLALLNLPLSEKPGLDAKLEPFRGRWTTSRERKEDDKVRRYQLVLDFKGEEMTFFTETDGKKGNQFTLKVIGIEQGVGLSRNMGHLVLGFGTNKYIIHYDFEGDRMILVGRMPHRPFEGFSLSGGYKRIEKPK